MESAEIDGHATARKVLSEMKTAESQDKLDELEKAANGHMLLIDQMTGALNRYIVALRRVVNKREAEAKKRLTDEELERKKKEEEQAKAAAQLAGRNLQYVDNVASFNWISSQTTGHPRIIAFKNDAAFVTAKADMTTNVFDQPFILKGSEIVGEALAHEQIRATDAGLLNKWCGPRGFVTKVSPTDANCDAVTHSIQAAQGLDVVAKMFDALVPGLSRVTVLPIPAMNKELNVLQLFGYSATYVRRSFEQDYFGVMRIIASGTMKVYCANPAHLKNVLSKHPEFLELIAGTPGTPPPLAASLMTFETLMKNITEELATIWGGEASSGKRLPLAHGTVHAGDVLYIPPGWFSCVAVHNGATSAGFRKMMLPKISDRTSLSTIRDCADGESKDSIQQCVTIFLNALSAL